MYSIKLRTFSHVVFVGIRISFVIFFFWGVTLYFKPPVISVRLQVIEFALFSFICSISISDFIAFQKSYISSIEFLANHGALACALMPTSHVSLIANRPLYAIVMFSMPLGSPKIA